LQKGVEGQAGLTLVGSISVTPPSLVRLVKPVAALEGRSVVGEAAVAMLGREGASSSYDMYVCM
jgi:hypothetical protein